MTRLLLIIFFTLLLTFSHTSYSMDYSQLPLDVWYPIIARCTPTNRNALRKICKLLGQHASKKNIPMLIQKLPLTPGNSSIFQLSPFDLEDAVYNAKRDSDITTLNLLKIYFFPNSNATVEDFVNEVMHTPAKKRYILQMSSYPYLRLVSEQGYPSALDRDLQAYNTQEKETAIETAIQHGHFECARTILVKHPDLITQALLITAVLHNNAECVEFLIARNMDVTQWVTSQPDYHADPHLETLVHRAVRNKAVGIVQQLVTARANVIEKDSDNNTPVELARTLLAKEPIENQNTSEYQEIIKILSNPPQQ